MTTKKQHYIPRMILKNYTYFQIPMKKPLIYQYDKNKKVTRLVDTKTICYKNNLYELKNSTGEIISELSNSIENYLSLYEKEWNNIINKIKHFEDLTDDDKTFMWLLIAFQFLRTPNAIGILKK